MCDRPNRTEFTEFNKDVKKSLNFETSIKIRYNYLNKVNKNVNGEAQWSIKSINWKFSFEKRFMLYIDHTIYCTKNDIKTFIVINNFRNCKERLDELDIATQTS
jgi:hypothetical protein